MNEKYLIPFSIIGAGALIALALFFGGGEGFDFNSERNTDDTKESVVRPVSKEDHVRGDKNARLSIIEYSDFECPFCARVHPTLTRIVEDFDGEVNWVYRHFPLSSIHFKADAAAEASECVAELGGNDAFWTFTDELFLEQARLGNALYEEIAEGLGISALELNTCLDSNKYRERVIGDRDNAVATGGRGTPHMVLVLDGEQVTTFAGALPYETVRELVEQVLAN